MSISRAGLKTERETRPPRPIPMASTSPLSDPQRQEVYRMENQELSGHYRQKAPRQLIYSTVQKLSRRYRVPKPRMYFGRLKGYRAWYMGGVIALDRYAGMSLMIVAHEFAHYLTEFKHAGVVDHGPTWCRYYAEMLDTLRLVPITGFRSIARKYGVRIAR